MQPISKQSKIQFSLAIASVFLGLFSVYWVANIWLNSFGGDFNIYWEAMEKAVAGADPYSPYQIGVSFIYHPFVLSIFSAFSYFFSRGASFTIWTVFSAFAWVLSIYFSLKMIDESRGEEKMRPDSRMIWLLLLSFGPFLETLWVGQINAFLVLALVLCFYFEAHDRPILAGLLLSFSIVVKVIPVVLVIYYLLRRSTKLLLGTGMGLSVFTLIALFQWGLPVTQDYLVAFLHLSNDIVPSVFNLSFQNLILRILGNHAGAGILAALNWGSKLLLGAGLLGWLYWVWKKQVKIGLEPTMMGWLGVIWASMFSPIVWYHHLSLVLFPILLLLLSEERNFRVAGAVILALIQIDRLFEITVMVFPLPVLLAQILCIYFIFRWLISRSPEIKLARSA